MNKDNKHARQAIARKKVKFSENIEPVGPEWAQNSVKAQQNPDVVTLHDYVCEVCGKTERLTEKDAFDAGWDYPPFIGAWGVVSPRTCPDCPMTETAWWHIVQQGTQDMPDKHKATVLRILAERDHDAHTHPATAGE